MLTIEIARLALRETARRSVDLAQTEYKKDGIVFRSGNSVKGHGIIRGMVGITVSQLQISSGTLAETARKR
jgi:hypothetical protein